eukprot:CAMPEP_0195284620 /NCGR_PEP_ID=MMETSP0707-20130614/2757_1 /TAXON_ID=33640 /ORGANISM="Asterionellopsis glacialis, Strain CCMP134" /LENGTH=601 /DNA_ID=CAMNT_0040343991 /DNA_START=19 /DNA_END=1824 /DNA_ORIENTATION=+
MSLNTFGDKIERKHEREKRIKEMKRAALGDTDSLLNTGLDAHAENTNSNSEHSGSSRTGRKESVQRGAIESVRHFLEDGSSSEEEDDYFYPMITSSQPPGVGRNRTLSPTRSAPKSSFLSDVMGFVLQPPLRNAETEMQQSRSIARAPPREVIDFFWDREPPLDGNVNLAPRFDPESGKSRAKHDKTYLEEVGLNNSSHHRRLGGSSHHRRLGGSRHTRRVEAIPEKAYPDNRKRFAVIAVIIAISVTLAGFAVVSIFKRRSANTGYSDNSGSDNQIKPETTKTNHSKRYETIRQIVIDSALSQESDVDRADSAQNLALKWIADEDTNEIHTDSDALFQRYALATFYYTVYPQGADEPNAVRDGNIGNTTNAIFNHWMSGSGICMWEGVTCPVRVHSGQETKQYNENSDIIGLNLTSIGLSGTLPVELMALENLEVVDLSSNELHGDIPFYLGHYRKLETLNLANNEFKSTIPKFFSHLSNLQVFDLSSNTIEGFTPDDIQKCTKLQKLKLNNNALVGNLPLLDGLASLEVLDLSNNSFVGFVPSSYGDMDVLTSLKLHSNRLQGSVPEIICSLTQNGLLQVLTTDCDKDSLQCDCCTSCY